MVFSLPTRFHLGRAFAAATGYFCEVILETVTAIIAQSLTLLIFHLPVGEKTWGEYSISTNTRNLLLTTKEMARSFPGGSS